VIIVPRTQVVNVTDDRWDHSQHIREFPGRPHSQAQSPPSIQLEAEPSSLYVFFARWEAVPIHHSASYRNPWAIHARPRIRSFHLFTKMTPK